MKAKKAISNTEDSTPLPQQTKNIKSLNLLFPVVGIGASVGGLDAFKKLLKAIHEDSGMAYVLVQHLDPAHESMLPELLQKVTNIPVLEITNDIKVLPNHIYVVPSNKIMVATDGILLLSPRPPKSRTDRSLPIDLFFTSLAEVHQTQAIGVVLSGAASDGTLGLKAIKDRGGITFAQDEASAAYESMPQNAVQAGVVDFILPPEKIPQKLLEIIGTVTGNGDEKDLPLKDEVVFKQIISLLRIRKGTDFTYYKQSTIHRRMLRRMLFNKKETPADYLQFLRENKSEQDLLFLDLLIPVTSFFRNEKSFGNLCEHVFPQIAKNKSPGEPIRGWVAGCSTGEEAFSIAISLKEFFGDNHRFVQIFATDLSEPAITKARRGIYTKNELKEVSPQRLAEFFKKTNGNFQVNKNVRNMCVFALHNFLKDPPFSKLDFISCRNVLIYMEPYLQKKALATFHYALNPKGFLLLGKSETTSGAPDLFASIVKNDKLYSRKDTPRRFVHVPSPRREQHFNPPNANLNNENIRTTFQKTADDILLRKYTPAGVLVNQALDIMYFKGNTSSYLEQSPSKPTHNLIQLAKNGLAFELRNILHKTKKENDTVLKENIPMEINGSLRYINIEAMPLPNTIEPYYLVLFHDMPAKSNPSLTLNKKSPDKTKKDDRDLRIQHLEQELVQIREDMCSITEDQEAAKEELQSTNEELIVVNQEMIALNEQLTSSRDYAEAIIINMREPLLVLDKSLRIKTANNAFYKTFRVNEQETEGVLIYNIGNKQWDIPALRTLLEKILPEKSVFNDFEVVHTFAAIGERIMLLNAREVINKNSSEKLILLSIEDITERKKAQEVLDKRNEHFKQLVKDLPAAVYACDAQGYLTFYNDAVAKLWGYTPVIGKDKWNSNFKFFHPDGSTLPFDEAPMTRILKEGVSISGGEYILERQDGTRSNVLLYPQPEFGLNGEIIGAINMIFDITEQVIARNKIEESEKRFRSLTDNVPMNIFIIEPDEAATVSYRNKSWLDFTGQTVDGAMNKTWGDTIHPDDVAPIMDVFLPAFRNREPYSLPRIRIKRHDGIFRWFQVQSNPRFLPNGDFIGYIGVSFEIHEQKLSEDALKESENKFRQMAELMPQKIWTADAEGNKNYFNKTLLDYAGMSFEELKGTGWEKINHPDDWKKNKKNWEESIRTGKNYESENRLLRNDGKFFWHLTRAVAIKEESGKIKMWVGSKTEIQEQKTQKEELEKSVLNRTFELQEANKELEQKNEELFLTKEKLLTEYSRSLIEASLDPLITINAEGKITDMNKAFTTITNVSPQKLIGTDFCDYFTDPQKALAIQAEVFAKGFVTNYPLTIIDGEPTAVLFNGSVYKDENKKVLGAVLVARDITEQKKVEKKFKDAKIFAETATTIAEDAKIQAENATRLANEAVHAKQQFLSNMSHEIRTPMNAIIGFTKVILKTELSAKQKEYLTAIKMSGDAMIILINDILDLAKVDSGKMTFEKIPFKMASSISSVFHLFELKTQEKNLKLVKDYDPKIPKVLLGDSVRLHQIILNLLDNAVKFTTKGEIKLSVRILEELETKVSIEFAVSDTGIGISKEKLEQVFDNFNQASSSTARLFGGTGLGLAIAKQLVEQQGGSIQLKSKVGEGSTFSFILNFQKTKEKVYATSDILKLDTEIKNIKVLVVEDMALNQLLMKTLLDKFGFERDIASNGKIAIEKLQKKSYDIILMDLQMPEMNGFEAAEYIRNTLNSKIPIIALTADVTTIDLAKCKAFGMNDYISKPVDERLLYNTIIALVQKPSAIKHQEEIINESIETEQVKCIDLTYLNKQTKSNPELMKEIISIYLEQTPPLISAMRQSTQDKDWDLLHAAVHKLIPSFFIVGINSEFEEIAKSVQKYASTLQHTEKIPNLVLQLDQVCTQACAALELEFNNIKIPSNE
ncbi:MAG: two-component system CheB/CheR fusion protein [Saprospiraceae bacterium]|jgi:two-component system CheB/CheR fusion protein